MLNLFRFSSPRVSEYSEMALLFALPLWTIKEEQKSPFSRKRLIASGFQSWWCSSWMGDAKQCVSMSAGKETQTRNQYR